MVTCYDNKNYEDFFRNLIGTVLCFFLGGDARLEYFAPRIRILCNISTLLSIPRSASVQVEILELDLNMISKLVDRGCRFQ